MIYKLDDSTIERLSRISVECGHDRLAIELFRRRNSLTPVEHFQLGEAFEGTGALAEAVESYAVAWRAGYLEAADSLSSALLDLERYADLDLHLQQGLKRGWVIPTLRLLAVLRDEQGKLDEATEFGRQAIAAGDIKGHSVLGQLLVAGGDESGALVQFERGHGLGDWRGTEGLAMLLLASEPQRSAALIADLISSGRQRGVYWLGRWSMVNGDAALAEASLLEVAPELHEAATVVVRLVGRTRTRDDADALISMLEAHHGAEWASVQRAGLSDDD